MRLTGIVIAARRCLAIAALLATACAPIEDADPGTPTPPIPDAAEAVAPAADQDAALRWVRANACDDQSPMSLTASDGTGLSLRSIKARAAVEGPVALTELHLSFDNPEDRQLEGRFAITLPPGAAISRFAMMIDGHWQEGEVVERQAARRAYEDFLHRQQDPALLENDAGNVFRARVFPIPPRGRKDIIIAYSQTLPAEGEPWRLPLCGLPTLGELDVDVAIVRGAAYIGSSLGGKATNVQHLTLREENFSPTKDLEAWAGEGRAQGIRHGDLAIARIKPLLTTAEAPLTTLTILFDTSASRALDFRGQVERLGELVAALAAAHPTLTLKVAAFDQELTSIYQGTAAGFGQAQLTTLIERGALGASDLHGALRNLDPRGLLSARVLLIGDGVATAGPTDAVALTNAVRALSRAGVERLDALVDGGIQDAAMLAQLTREGLETDGILLDARMELSSIVDRLGRATRSGIAVDVPGAEWVWPRTLDGVQSGDEILIYAQLPPEQELEVVLEGAELAQRRPTLSIVPGPLLGRAHAEARIAGLQAQLSSLGSDAPDGAQKRAQMQAKIVALSTRHRVLSDYTALLVLETEDDYRRFGIDRNALTDVLTVGPAGVDTLQRRGVTEAVAPEVRAKAAVQGEESDAKKAKADDRFAQAGDGDPTVPETNPTAAPSDEAAAFRDVAEQEVPGAGAGEGGPADGRLHLGASAAPSVPANEPVPEPEPVHREIPDADLAARDQPSLDGAPAERASHRREADPAPPAPRGSSGGTRRSRIASRSTPRPATPAKEAPHLANPWDGRFDTVMQTLASGKTDAARRDAAQWRQEQPGDVLALVALGEVHEAAGDTTAAARAYGSLIDLFPSRADLRRMAGERLERLGAAGLPLATDTYDKALQSRPDQPSGARLLAYALAKQADYKAAFETLEAAFDREYPSGRFAEIHRILREDLGLIGKAWITADPTADKSVRAAWAKRGVVEPRTASTRFVLTWETDANDVDLHVYDARGNHAYYSNKALASGGELYADVTTGYGPECFTIEGKPGAGPYTLQAHYYRRGPMGYGMGKLQVLKHDGLGHLEFGDHPFVIMRDDAFVDLAKVTR